MKLICRPIRHLQFSAKFRPQGYLQHILSECESADSETWCMREDVFLYWRARYDGGFVPGGEQFGEGPTQAEPLPPPATCPSPWDFGPGSVLKAAIKAVTGEVPSPNCSCTARARQMNQWGWLGCIKNRKQILAWLAEEAKKRGHEINGRQALGVFRAAWKEVRGREASGSAQTDFAR